jgi:hypothetical protein
MSNMWNVAKYNMETANFNWTGADWFCALLPSTYTPNFVTDLTAAALISAALNSVLVNLGTLAVSTAGVLSANSATFTGISSSQTVTAVGVYWNNGSTTFPFLYMNVGTGLPLSTTGANITVDWNNVAVNGPLFTL